MMHLKMMKRVMETNKALKVREKMIRKILKKIFNVEDRYSDKEAEDIEYYKTLEELNLEGQEEGQHGVQCAQQ